MHTFTRWSWESSLYTYIRKIMLLLTSSSGVLSGEHLVAFLIVLILKKIVLFLYWFGNLWGCLLYTSDAADER